MAILGDFTPEETIEPPAEPDYFLLCGEEFELPAAAAAGSFLRYANSMKRARDQGDRGDAALRRARGEEAKLAARAMQNESNMSAMAAVWDLMTSLLGPDQIDRFMRVVDNNNIDVDGVLGLISQIETAIGGRPTKRSSDSSAGPSTTGPNSTDAGYGPTDPVVTAVETLSPREQQIQDMERHLVTPGSLADSRT